MPLLQSSKYTLVEIPSLAASEMAFSISLKCCSGVFLSWCVRWFIEPLVKRFWTLAPDFFIQSIETPPSTNVNTSTRLIYPLVLAHSVICCTAESSPSDTLAEATSILSTFNSSNNNLAKVSFSDAEKDTPEVCSPSRRVVSIISIILRFIYAELVTVCLLSNNLKTVKRPFNLSRRG